MTLKSKKKSQKYLILIISILAIVLVMLVTRNYYSNSPQNSIIFIQYEGESSDLWQANSDNPRDAYRLTNNDNSQTRIFRYESATNGDSIVYSLYSQENYERELYLLDVSTRQNTKLTSCSEVDAFCDIFALSPTGDFVMYYHRLYPNYHELRLIDLRESPFVESTIFEFDINEYWYYPNISVVGNSNIFTFELLGEPFEFQLYDAEQQELLETLPLGTPSRYPIFSDDGSRYAYYISERDMEPRLIGVRQTDPPNTILSNYRDWDYDLTATGWVGAVIYDWHPDNRNLLIGVANWQRCEGNSTLIFHLHTFDTTTGDVMPLPIYGDSYTNARWNIDGSEIIYNAPTLLTECDNDYLDQQLSIYELNSETFNHLSIAGLNAQWINR